MGPTAAARVRELSLRRGCDGLMGQRMIRVVDGHADYRYSTWWCKEAGDGRRRQAASSLDLFTI